MLSGFQFNRSYQMLHVILAMTLFFAIGQYPKWGFAILTQPQQEQATVENIVKASKVSKPHIFSNHVPLENGELYSPSRPLLNDDFHKNANHSTAIAHKKKKTNLKNWPYTLLSMLVISVLGLLAVITVPLIQRLFFEKVINFLVALAVGCLTSDALLHLLPHALQAPNDHHESGDHSHSQVEHSHSQVVIHRALCTVAGIYTFLICERFGKRRSFYKLKQRRQEYLNNKISFPPTTSHSNLTEGETQERLISSSHHQDNCQMDMNTGHHHHFGSSHQHYSPDADASAGTARMLVIGDVLHNFADGLAVGAAYCNHISAGICTAIAVVCHELPHEIGLFAVLLRLKISVRKAVVFNCISSISSIIGSMCGLYVGQRWNIAPWIFAIIAGIFLYLALVDMLPELRIDPDSVWSGMIIELFGFACGILIMTVIAVYEHQINHFLPMSS